MTADATKKVYHYALLERNRARVRDQGTAINRSLKALRSISDASVPAAKQAARMDEDITQQHITLPQIRAVDQRLRIALEEAEADRDSTPPAPMHKRWYRWND